MNRETVLSRIHNSQFTIPHSQFFMLFSRQPHVLWLMALLLLLVACGREPAEPTPTLDPVAAAGEIVFQKNCGSCHATSPDTVIVGPSLAGIATRAETRIPGQDARSYILSSIMRPDEFLSEGFENLMPNNFGRKLTGEEIDAVIAYLLTLK